MGESEYFGIARPDDWRCGMCGRSRGEHRCVSGFSRIKYNFVGMLRIKNEERWLPEAIESLLPLCGAIFIMDDHSTDASREICQRYASKVTVLESPFVGINESRDKNWLLDQLLIACEPQLIICIDGDEALEERGPGIIWETCAANTDATAFSLQIAFLWGSRDHVRVDRIYGDFWRPSLFRPFIERPGVPDDAKIGQEFRFMATPFGRRRGTDKPNLHCSSVPQRRLHGRRLCPVRIKHFGYMAREDRVRKLDFYTSIDWLNDAEDCYRHMTQGDGVTLAELPRVNQLISEGILSENDAQSLCSIPSDARLVHAGPLRIIPWKEDSPWEISEWARREHSMPQIGSIAS